MDVQTILSLLQGPGALLIFLLLVIWAGLRQIWVWGWLYREALRDRDAWRKRAEAAIALAEAAVRPKATGSPRAERWRGV